MRITSTRFFIRNHLRWSAITLALFAAGPAHASQVWFQQPTVSIGGTFQVAKGPQPGKFSVIQWQPNPLTSNHQDVPVTWNIAKYTGLAVPAPLSPNQAGTANRIGSTGVQMSGNTIGININSLDFSPTGTWGHLVGIMPNYVFPNTSYRPFAQAGTTLVFSTDLQVVSAALTPPAGAGSTYTGQAYVDMDLRIIDTSHPATPPITISVGAFAMHGAPRENVGYTSQGGGRILLNTSISPTSRFVTPVPGTQPYQSKVWTGFRTFATGLTAANLTNGLAAIRADSALLRSLGLTAASYSTNPADYALQEVHINSEVNYAGRNAYTGGSVQMGLAVRNILVTLQ